MTATAPPPTSPAALLRRRAQVFHAMTDAVLVVDLGGWVVDANPAASGFFGADREALAGRMLAEVVDPEWAFRKFSPVVDAVRRDGQWTGDEPVTRSDGRHRISSTMMIGVHDDDEQLLGLVAVYRDVTAERQTTARLAEAEMLWRLTLDVAPVGVALVAPDGTFLRVNAALSRMFGYSEVDLQARNLLDLIHPEDGGPAQPLIDQLVEGRIDHYVREGRYLHADGHELWVRASVAVVRVPVGDQPLHYVILLEDITAQHRADRLARSRIELTEAVVQAQTAIAELELNPQQVMQELVAHAQRLTSADGAVMAVREGDELVYRTVSGCLADFSGFRIPATGGIAGLAVARDHAVVSSDPALDARSHPEVIRMIGVRSLAVCPVHRGGRIVGVLTVMSLAPDAFSLEDEQTLELLTAPFSGALARAWALEPVAGGQPSFTDPLTGLLNRHHALQELDRALEQQHRDGGHTALLLVDLDGFHLVNETFGESTGDELLSAVAGTIRQAVRASDTPARYEDDRFAIVCSGLGGTQDAMVLAQRLLALLPGDYLVGQHAVQVGASIGISIALGDVPDAIDLVDGAESAVYEAKHRGGNRTVVRSVE